MLQKIVIRITNVRITKVIIPQIGIAKAKIAEILKFSMGLTMLICVLNTSILNTSSFAAESDNNVPAIASMREAQLNSRNNKKEADRIRKEANGEFISFVQAEKHLQSHEEAKKWINQNQQEAETLKYFLVGLKQTREERAMICNDLLRSVMPSIKEYIEYQEKILNQELAPPVNQTYISYKLSLEAIEREIANYKIPKAWYWLLRDSMQRISLKQQFYFKEFSECIHVLNKNPYQLVDEFYK